MLSFLDPVVGLAHSVLTLLLEWLTPLMPAVAAGAAVVVLTMAVRLVLHPLARAQVRGEKARAALAPQLKELSQEHGADRARLAEETMRLYRESGTSPFAGIGPTLLQLPVFSVLYRLFTTDSISGVPNDLLHHTVFGTALGAHVSFSAVWLFVFASLAVTATLSGRWAKRLARAQGMAQSGWVAKLTTVLPYVTVLFAAFVPLAAALYLVTTTTWTAIERRYLHRHAFTGAKEPVTTVIQRGRRNSKQVS